MLKYIGVLFFFWALLTVSSYANEIETVTVNVNGRQLQEKGLIREGVAYVPLHKVLGTLNVPYKWDPKQRRLIVNGKVVTGKAIRYKGILYVSSVSISNNTKATIRYLPDQQVVFLENSNKVASVPSNTAMTGTNTTIKSAQPSVKNTGTATIAAPFVPVLGENDVFKIAVTNLEQVHSIKGQKTTNANNKFVVAYLSQQNISNEVQIYTGKFAMLDTNRNVYEYSEGLSNFWLMVLHPGGSNFGYIVFEIPQSAQPMQLVLSSTTRPPLALDLK